MNSDPLSTLPSLPWLLRPLALILALAMTGMAGPALLRAQTIDTIVVERQNVYAGDREAPKLIAAFANALHIRTRQTVVLRTLLLKTGQPYDSAKVAESERLLRQLGIFRSVRLDTLRVGDRFALRVRTADNWSTIPDFQYLATAGDLKWAVSLTEANLLGSGTALTGSYEKTPDRRTGAVGFRSLGLLGRRTEIATDYQDFSDGHRGRWLIGIPFYETATRLSLLADGELRQERTLQFRDGLLADSPEHRELLVRLGGGYALRGTPLGYSRLWLTAVWRREDFAPQSTAVFPRSQFATLGAGLELRRVHFQVLDSFNSFARKEDVDVSALLRVGIWAAPGAFGYRPGQAGIGGELGGQFGGIWPGGFAVLRGRAAGMFTGAGLDSARLNGSITVVTQNLLHQTLIVHAEGRLLRRPKPGDEFDLWRDNKGPRLFGSHAFTGSRMAWVTLEDRFLVKRELLGVLGLGLAPFLDWGGAWYPDEPVRLGGDAGLALRVGPTRLALNEVGQFAIGYRFGKGFNGRRWAITVRGSVTY